MPPKGWHPTPEQLQKLRDSHKGQKPWNTGKHVLLNNCLETRRKNYLPEKHYRWKGGVTPEQIRIRHSNKIKAWRVDVFERDDWTCQSCDSRGVDLQAHHIYSFADFPDKRFSLDNGITLCIACHHWVTWELEKAA